MQAMMLPLYITARGWGASVLAGAGAGSGEPLQEREEHAPQSTSLRRAQ